MIFLMTLLVSASAFAPQLFGTRTSNTWVVWMVLQGCEFVSVLLFPEAAFVFLIFIFHSQSIYQSIFMSLLLVSALPSTSRTRQLDGPSQSVPVNLGPLTLTVNLSSTRFIPWPSLRNTRYPMLLLYPWQSLLAMKTKWFCDILVGKIDFLLWEKWRLMQSYFRLCLASLHWKLHDLP